MVDFGDMADKAKDLAGEHSDQVEGGIDKAADFARDKFGDNAAIDQVEERASDFVEGQGDQQ